jgi:hypothetical protein
MRDARGDSRLGDETRLVERSGDGGGALRQAFVLRTSRGIKTKKSGSPEGPTLNERSSENDRYEMKCASYRPNLRVKARKTDLNQPSTAARQMKARGRMLIRNAVGDDCVLRFDLARAGP